MQLGEDKNVFKKFIMSKACVLSQITSVNSMYFEYKDNAHIDKSRQDHMVKNI